MAKILALAHTVEGVCTDFTSSIDTEFVPQFDRAVITAGGRPLTIDDPLQGSVIQVPPAQGANRPSRRLTRTHPA